MLKTQQWHPSLSKTEVLTMSLTSFAMTFVTFAMTFVVCYAMTFVVCYDLPSMPDLSYTPTCSLCSSQTSHLAFPHTQVWELLHGVLLSLECSFPEDLLG